MRTLRAVLLQVVVTSNTPRLFESCGLPRCFVFRKQAHCFALVVSLLSLVNERYSIKKEHRSKMSPQINFQGPLSDQPRFHVVTFCNMVAEMAELKI